jgi:probable rRNA maturation factor
MMILLDPDLDPDAISRSVAGKPLIGAKTSDLRMPSTRSLARFLTQARAAVRLRGQVSVLFTTDAMQRRLNRRFRSKNSSTDVLSFPANSNIPGAGEMAGDLSISVPMAQRQAAQQGHALGTELKVLILHGLLHLAGYDHETDTGQMARRERTLRARLRLPGGLIERVAMAKKRSAPNQLEPAAKRRRT